MSERFPLIGPKPGPWLLTSILLAIGGSGFFLLLVWRRDPGPGALLSTVPGIVLMFVPALAAMLRRRRLSGREIELTPNALRELHRGIPEEEIPWSHIRGIEGVRSSNRWNGRTYALVVHRPQGRPLRIVVASDLTGEMPDRKRFLQALASRGFRVLDLGASGG